MKYSSITVCLIIRLLDLLEKNKLMNTLLIMLWI